MWCASHRPPLGVCLVLSLFAVPRRFSLQLDIKISELEFFFEAGRAVPLRARSLDHRRYLAGCSTRCARPTTRAPDQRLTPSSSPHAAAEHSHCGGGVLRLLGTHAHRQQARRAPHRRGSLPRPSSRLRHRRAACTHQARPPLSRGCSLRRRPSPSGSPPPPAGSRRTPLSGASSSTLRFTCSPSREARGQTCTC